MGIFGRDGSLSSATTELGKAGETTAGATTSVIERLMDVGIDGRGPFDSAQWVAEIALAESSGVEPAIDAMVRSHLKLAAANGFVTGMGGLVALPVALPANVLGFYLVASRLVAGIAATRGYDLRRADVRSAVLLALVGADADDLLAKARYAGTGGFVSLAAERLPGPALMAVNKGVAFRLLSQVGKKALTRFGRVVPVVGGVVCGALDAYLLRRIADHARLEFPLRAEPVS